MTKPSRIKLNLQLFSSRTEDQDEYEEVNDTTEPEDDELDTDDTEIEEDDNEEEQEEKEEEEFDEITYNKEKVKIPKKDRATYLQKGYNYDKVHAKATEYESDMNRIEKLTGMSRKEVIAYLEKQQDEAEIQSRAEKYGLSEDDAKREYEKDKRLKEIEEKLSKTERQTALQEQKASFKDKPFFVELEKDIENLVNTVPNVDVATAYKYLLGEKFEELTSNKSKMVEKRTIANIQDRSKRGIVEGGEADRDTGNNTLSEKGSKIARAFGFDPKEIAKHVSKAKKERFIR